MKFWPTFYPEGRPDICSDFIKNLIIEKLPPSSLRLFTLYLNIFPEAYVLNNLYIPSASGNQSKISTYQPMQNESTSIFDMLGIFKLVYSVYCIIFDVISTIG